MPVPGCVTSLPGCVTSLRDNKALPDIINDHIYSPSLGKSDIFALLLYSEKCHLLASIRVSTIPLLKGIPREQAKQKHCNKQQANKSCPFPVNVFGTCSKL